VKVRNSPPARPLLPVLLVSVTMLAPFSVGARRAMPLPKIPILPRTGTARHLRTGTARRAPT
ncbi:MAG: hypothetical protein WCI39_11850, partial [Gallionellaceae bacterium]